MLFVMGGAKVWGSREKENGLLCRLEERVYGGASAVVRFQAVGWTEVFCCENSVRWFCSVILL